MPYNSDPARLNQMLPYLAPLAEGKDAQWTIVRGSANTVAYRIREALFIARQHPTEYPDLARFASDYSIGVVNGDTVRARRRTPMVSAPSPVEALDALVEVPAAQPVDASTLRRQPSVPSAPFAAGDVRGTATTSTDGPQTVGEIVSKWDQLKGTKRTLYFPEARLTEREMAQLWYWAEDNTVMLLAHKESVTLAVRDPQMMEFSYRPDPAFLEAEFGEDTPGQAGRA